MSLNTKRLSLAALLTSLALCTSTPTRADDAQDVTAAVEKLRTAMMASDHAVMRALIDDSASYGHSAGKVDTKTSFIAAYDGKPRFSRIDHKNLSVAITGTNAIVRNIFDADTLSPEGKVTPVHLGILQVWRKNATGWQLLARQAVPVPRG